MKYCKYRDNFCRIQHIHHITSLLSSILHNFRCFSLNIVQQSSLFPTWTVLSRDTCESPFLYWMYMSDAPNYAIRASPVEESSDNVLKSLKFLLLLNLRPSICTRSSITNHLFLARLFHHFVSSCGCYTKKIIIAFII